MRVPSWIFSVAVFTLAGCGQVQFSGVTPSSASVASRTVERPAARGESESVLYSFTSHGDGAVPLGGLVADSTGVFFGTTERGGRIGCPGDGGHGSCGTVFALIPQATGYYERQLYRFCIYRGCPDGEYPEAGLFKDDKGAFYGTGYAGGAYGRGVVFKISPDGKKYRESLVYTFCSNVPNCGDGSNPHSALIRDRSGALYGTTLFGGNSNAGVVFKVAPAETHYNETVLHAFNGPDGEYPEAGLVADRAGALYGTTSAGGSGTCYSGTCGVVFKLTPAASGYTESTIYAFSGADGAEPLGGLVLDKHGNLYGTTEMGGNTSLCYNAGCGTVFELSPSGSGYAETLLHTFTGGSDGSGPDATLVMGKNGDLFGSTALGGCCNGGVIFRLRPAGSVYSERVLYNFCSQYRCHDGEYSRAPLILYRNELYGTTSAGGGKGHGTIYSVTP